MQAVFGLDSRVIPDPVTGTPMCVPICADRHTECALATSNCLMRTDAELLAEDFGAFYERHVTAVTAYVARRTRKPDADLRPRRARRSPARSSTVRTLRAAQGPGESPGCSGSPAT